MKKILMISVIILFGVNKLFAQSLWTVQVPYPTFNELNSVFFVDENTGWTVGDKIISKTTNGGFNWTNISNGINNYWRTVFFSTPQEGYILSDSGKLFKTINGGNNWFTQSTGTSTRGLNSIYFFDDSTGWIVGDSGLILKTTNHGLNWFTVSSPVGRDLNDIKFTSATKGCIVGMGVVLNSTDGGSSWTFQFLWDDNGLQSVCFTSPDTGWASGPKYGTGTTGTLLKTTDGGLSWDELYINNSLYWIKDVQFINSNTGYLGGGWPFRQNIYKTTNGGNNWVYLGDSSQFYLNSFQMVNSSTGYAVGRVGSIIKTTNSGDNWFSLRSGSFWEYNSVWFASQYTGCAFGTDIFKTNDGGQTWIKKNDDHTTVYIKSKSMLDASTGFATGSNRVYKTTDAWESWTVTAIPYPNSFNSISFANKDSGWVVGDYNKTYRTTDGGGNWYQQLLPFGNAHYHSVFFVSDSVGWLSGWYAGLLKTTNFGATWSQQNAGTNVPFSEMFFVSEQTGWGINSNIYRTTNGGINWIVQLSDNPILDDYRSIHFTDPNNGWAASGSRIVRTTNGGNTWPLQLNVPLSGYHAIYFVNPQIGWVVGQSGLIMKYYDVILSSNENNNSVPQSFFLGQNYPNPFNPVTHLEFGISELGFISLKIYNILGVEVATLVNQRKNPGRYSVEFNGENFSSGIYFYRLEVDGNVIDTKMMVLLK